jgi:hypothetical protein
MEFGILAQGLVSGPLRPGDRDVGHRVVVDEIERKP